MEFECKSPKSRMEFETHAVPLHQHQTACKSTQRGKLMAKILFAALMASVAFNIRLQSKTIYLEELLSLCRSSEKISPSIEKEKKDTKSSIEEANVEASSGTKAKTSVKLNDITLLSLIGSGTVSMGFKASIKGLDGFFAAKFTGDHYLHWSDVEIEMFEILNEKPAIPNIPRLLLAIRSMPNHFSYRHLRDLKVSRGDAEWLKDRKNISLLVTEYLGMDKHRVPSNISELRTFLRSLMFTFNFTHSRNVMLCDLHPHNIYFDGKDVKLYDWNAGFIYKPNSVPLHYHQEPTHLMPPEAWNNESAVHASVSGFDIYSTGILVNSILESHMKRDAVNDVDYPLLLDFANATMIHTPEIRPDAGKMLNHAFLKRKGWTTKTYLESLGKA